MLKVACSGPGVSRTRNLLVVVVVVVVVVVRISVNFHKNYCLVGRLPGQECGLPYSASFQIFSRKLP